MEDWSEAAEYSAFTPLSMLPTAENRAALSERRKVQPDGPFFLVSVGTVPGVRAKGMVLRSLESLLNMARAPDCTLLVAPRSFMRFPNETVNLEQIRGRLSEKAQKNPTLRMRYCARDYGPGSKLLCALPVLRRLAKPAMERWMIVLADDDIEKALEWLKKRNIASAKTRWEKSEGAGGGRGPRTSGGENAKKKRWRSRSGRGR